MRKTPIQHAVRSYKRNGKIVHSHLRGYGYRSIPGKDHKLPKDYLVVEPKELNLRYMPNYHFPHTEAELRKDYHCPTCVCDLTDEDFNPDPEESDDHCPTCTCEHPELQSRVAAEIKRMKVEAKKAGNLYRCIDCGKKIGEIDVKHGGHRCAKCDMKRFNTALDKLR